MAFIRKDDPVVINIKLTSKGRELLSKGKLTFKKFAIGDSEINYDYNNRNNFNPFNLNILKPKDKNPKMLSFITKTLSGDTINDIEGDVVSTPQTINNETKEFGFFEIISGDTNFLNDEMHVRQPDIMVELNSVTGGTKLKLLKSPKYLANVNEPNINDYILIKWTTPDGNSTTGYTVNHNTPTPYLVYKIHDKLSGSLSNNDLIIEVDRELPNFNGNGDNIFAGGLVYPNRITITGITNSSDFINEATLAFINNYEQPQPEIPFWNLSIIFTEEIIGVQSDNKKYGKFKTNKYNGFVQYIQNLDSEIKKIGAIHYTNLSPENTYGEGFYQDTPVLEIPYIMWHKSSGNTMGLALTCGDEHILEGLDTKYYDLIDDNGNILGKCFSYLKMFVIEDQELLYAMSYKSNRSWTLPECNVNFNTTLNMGCPICSINTEIEYGNPTGASDNGFIKINDISDTFGDILIILKYQDTNNTTKTINIPADEILTLIPYKFDVPAGIYDLEIYDLGAIGETGNPCVKIYNDIIIEEFDSTLEIYDVEPTE